MSTSESAPVNTTATTTNATESNAAVTNSSGLNIVGSKGVNLTTSSNSGNTSNANNTNTNSNNSVTYSTDDGAVKAGTALGQSAIAANVGLSESLASEYADELNNSATSSTNLVSSVLSQGFSFLASENNTIESLESQNATASSTSLGNFATTLSNIATAQDTSQAAQSTAFATTSLKIAAVVVLGIALIYFATKSNA